MTKDAAIRVCVHFKGFRELKASANGKLAFPAFIKTTQAGN